ncbi:MAG: hypothetical protein JWP58_3489 [Hymenobacter sp.]|nr:hypothetical protein [Hymenobacter sp.]
MRTAGRKLTVGLIGENPNDTNALIELLNHRYAGRFVACQLVKKQTGDRLGSAKTQRMLASNYQAEKPRLVVYIRDLDAPNSDVAKHRERQQEFANIKKIVGEQALFLLHVQQFEALLWADIEKVNQHYGVSLTHKGDPTTIPEPKRKLISATDKPKATKQYSPNDSAELAAKLDYDTLLRKCLYFSEFDKAFAAKLLK